jgi:threonylcarbamoyladenosine tRNA methylthiotransferase MtaB
MKVFLDSVGCRLNQSEIERIARQFLQAGHALVADVLEADLVVINTCAVTAKAASDSRGKIRLAARVNPNVKIISTGCWSTLEPERAAQMDNIVQLVLNENKDTLAQNFLGSAMIENDTSQIESWPSLPGSHADLRAFIKVQDGCDNFCTFCVTRVVRGKSTSLPLQSILSEIQSAVKSGVNEVVLSGVNLGSWGRDHSHTENLKYLLRTILKETDIQRIRLSSLEPWDIDASFFELWDNPRLCRHFHLPLQSGSDRILKRMGRRITSRNFLRLVQEANAIIPDLALTTDIIIGFPGEEQVDFEQTSALVEEAGFSGGHVFNYSPRPKTPALELTPEIEPAIKKERSRLLRLQFQVLERQFRFKQIDKTFQVLWEHSAQIAPGSWKLTGFTDTYLKTQLLCSEDRLGKMESIRITGVVQSLLQGNVQD